MTKEFKKFLAKEAGTSSGIAYYLKFRDMLLTVGFTQTAQLALLADVLAEAPTFISEETLKAWNLLNVEEQNGYFSVYRAQLQKSQPPFKFTQHGLNKTNAALKKFLAYPVINL